MLLAINRPTYSLGRHDLSSACLHHPILVFSGGQLGSHLIYTNVSNLYNNLLSVDYPRCVWGHNQVYYAVAHPFLCVDTIIESAKIDGAQCLSHFLSGCIALDAGLSTLWWPWFIGMNGKTRYSASTKRPINLTAIADEYWGRIGPPEQSGQSVLRAGSHPDHRIWSHGANVMCTWPGLIMFLFFQKYLVRGLVYQLHQSKPRVW